MTICDGNDGIYSPADYKYAPQGWQRCAEEYVVQAQRASRRKTRKRVFHNKRADIKNIVIIVITVTE